MGWAFVAIVAVAVSLPLAAIGVAPAPPSLPDPNSPSVSVLAAPPLSTPSVTAKTPVPPARKNARAQQASLSGAVHDETGGVIPGASVSLTNSQTQESAAAVTNVSGAFQFGNLPPGQYVLVTQLSGFRKRQVSIDLSAGSAASLTVTLEVGALSEALTVSCKAPSVIDRFFPTLSAQERPSAPIRVGGSIKAPRKTNDVRPVCPDAGVTAPAVVILEGYVGVDGFVTGLKALSEAETVPARFIESAMDAVQQWEFTPTLLNGVPVPVVFTVTVSFTRG
jgi:hypothetical protein